MSPIRFAAPVPPNERHLAETPTTASRIAGAEMSPTPPRQRRTPQGLKGWRQHPDPPDPGSSILRPVFTLQSPQHSLHNTKNRCRDGTHRCLRDPTSGARSRCIGRPPLRLGRPKDTTTVGIATAGVCARLVWHRRASRCAAIGHTASVCPRWQTAPLGHPRQPRMRHDAKMGERGRHGAGVPAARSEGRIPGGGWRGCRVRYRWQLNVARRANFLHKIEQLTLFVRFGGRYSSSRNFNFNCSKQGECK